MKKQNTVVLWHADADGFAAAFAIWLQNKKDESYYYIPVQYNQPVPQFPPHTGTVLIVDFSYPREECERLNELFELRIFDHHQTAKEELKGLNYAVFSSEKSGCGLVWEAFHKTPMPAMLQYIQDRDLWQFKLPDSEIINMFIGSLPYEFIIWERFIEDDERFVQSARFAGSAIHGFRDVQIQSALRNTRMMRFTVDEDSYEVPVVNCSANISEVGNILCQHYPESKFSASYCDRKDVRSWSLRSVGDFDVSVIARMFGGGGHKNAAGFSTEIGWPEVHPDEFVEEFDELSEVKENLTWACCGRDDLRIDQDCPVCGDKA